MKKVNSVIIMTVAAFFALTVQAYAKEAGGHDHGSHSMDHSGHTGENIHNSEKDSYRLAYHLIDMKAQMAAMKDHGHAKSMENMDITHHLMVYITDADGNNVTDAKVGYLVINPDGTKQKVMCMAMKGGFGADISLKQKGAYTIKTKAVSGDKRIMDTFRHENR